MSVTRSEYKRARYLCDQAADLLADALRTDPRGRPGLHPRIWMVGLNLSISVTGSATVTSIYKILTHDLPRDLQWDLGVLTGPGTNPRRVSLAQLYSLTKRISKKLDYSVARQPHLTDEQRRERFTTLQSISHAQLKPTLILRPDGSTDYAVDGTGLDAPELPPRKPTELPDPDWHEEDADTPETEQERLTVTPGKGSKGASDAGWGWRSTKHGRQIYYGYDVEGLIHVPPTGQKGNARKEPALLAALVVIPGGTDIVEPVLGLIDLLTDHGATVGSLLGDRHYSYKRYDRWLTSLMKRGVSPVSDIRIDDQGFNDWDGLKIVASHPHCPFTPDHLGRISRPASDAKPDEVADFTAAIEERQAYACQIVNRATHDNQRVRVRCPARNGSMGCPRVEGTVAVALENNLPVAQVEDDVRPPICQQQTVTLRIDTEARRRIMKLMQDHYWGSPAWQASYNRRSNIEGYFGCLQNEKIGSVDKDTHQHRGLALVTLIYSAAAAFTNVHNLRKWHQDTGNGDPTHPLLMPDHDFHGFKELDAAEARDIDIRESSAVQATTRLKSPAA